MQKLAILGGTFNPVHLGHLILAETAFNQLELDHVIWVPTHVPPHKATADVLEFQHRLEMVERAIAPHPAFQCATTADLSPGSSYAIDTLTALKAQFPESQWYWILGLDAFQALPRWYHRHELASQCCWLIAPRQVHASRTSAAPDLHLLCQAVAAQLQAQAISIQWQLLSMPIVEISSSLIRQYCRDRRSIRYLVPESVRIYISAYHLYRQPQ